MKRSAGIFLFRRVAHLILFILLCWTCLSNVGWGLSIARAANSSFPRSRREPLHLGVDVLEDSRFRVLWGKRVGLLTHPAGVNRYGTSTIDVLRRHERVNLVALFGPEHGIYGNAKADEPVQDVIDPRTGLPVFSLYGRYRKPTPEILNRIDVLVVDLQDLGVRSYTYVSCMRLAMEACFETDKSIVILDRPNPLGGLKVDGPFMEKRWVSYVGTFRVPYVHGLTIGELAQMAKIIPGWLEIDDETRRQGKLTVIPMRGWRRDMMWPDTGLAWVPTSPAIPNLSAAMGYSMTGLGAQIGKFSHGYGTRYPFRLLSFKGRDPRALELALRDRQIPGLDYITIQYADPARGLVEGVYVKVSDWPALRPTEISFHMMQVACQWSETNPFASASATEGVLFNKHVGSSEWWNAIRRLGANVDIDAFIRRWQAKNTVFQSMSRRFWIYR